MKEPWKKTCNGKVIITLNDEKTAPTEVEVPVDLNWTNRSDKKYSAPKAIILMAIVLILGLTVVTLFKVQNLVYSTSYINWHMQELESTVSDSNDDVKLIKYKMSLKERDDEIALAKAARAEPLISSNVKNNEPQIDSDDLKLSESHNQNHKLLSNSWISGSADGKNTKETEVQHSKGSDIVISNVKTSPAETKNKISESTDLNDGREHPNPADPEEWIKPLVETFDIFGNQPIEDHFIQNVLMKLLIPENNFEVLEFNKMHETGNNALQENANQNTILNPIIRNNKEKIIKPLPLPIESILMKSLLPPVSNFKIFHFNEKLDQQQQNSMEDDVPPKMAFQNVKIKPMPVEGIVKSLLPQNNMKIFQLNNKQEQNPEEDMPKITIQSIKLKLLPLPPQEDFGGRRDAATNANPNNNFEIIRLNESPEPSQEVEAPKMAMPLTNFNPFPIPIQDILMKTILPASKNIEILHLNDKLEDRHLMQHLQHPQDSDMDFNQSEKFNPLPIPIQNILMKTLLPPPNQNADEHFSGESQDQSHKVEVSKIPIYSMKVEPYMLPNLDAPMKSMLPVNNYGEKALLPPPNQNADEHFSGESQDQSHKVEVSKIPSKIYSMKVEPFILPNLDAPMKSMLPVNNYGEKTLLPPLNQNADEHFNGESQDQSHKVEVPKIPSKIYSMKVEPFILPNLDAPMKSMLPVNNYGESLANVSDSFEETEQQQQPHEPLPQQPHNQSEVPKVMARSTKLNPVDEAKTAALSIPYPAESAEK